MTHKWRLIWWLLVPFYLHAQVDPSFLKQVKASVTEAISFDKNDFKSDAQFWTMCEDRNGILIFGNNDGILT
ncbi:MAG TPA: hypothetical protein PKD13_07930, partial [Mariniflexile sp.]|nr:hypothetical protein [Mariniflexile sp.]